MTLPHSFILCRNRCSSLRASRGGLTLVEMLVSMALTLVLMGAVAQVFGMLGQGVNGSRSMAELNDRMRATMYRLRQDLDGMTVDLTKTPPLSGSKNTGYLEIIEGPASDANLYDNVNNPAKQFTSKSASSPMPSQGNDDRLVGDIDDVIMFTTQATGDMFTGRADTRNNNLEGGGLRSPYAEVSWFCLKNDLSSNPQTYTLYRHQRLVMAHPGAEPFVNTTSGGVAKNSFGGPPNAIPFSDWQTIYALTDVSCRKQGSLALPNSLADLARRENRFMHGSTFPFIFPIPIYATSAEVANQTFSRTGSRFGEDVILTNVIAFDVRVWDPNATVQAVPGYLQTNNVKGNETKIAAVPGDPGYGGTGFVQAALGAYVDLGWGRVIGTAATAGTTLQQFKKTVSSVPNSTTLQDPNVFADTTTYDTWTDFYEVNGVDDDGDGVRDDSTNGLDDNNVNGVDEANERESSPPYAVPLQGIQIRLRCYEPSSGQVRQTTINSF